MTTLTRERRQRFEAIILSSELYAMAEEDQFAGKEERINAVKTLAGQLADAAASRTEQKTDEEQPEYKHTGYMRGDQERPDKMDEYLKMANAPGMKKAVRVDNLLSAWAVAFTVNTTAKDWTLFARYAIDMQERNGWEPKVFIKWVKSQDGYPAYWSRKRMEENYPKAYAVVENTTREEGKSSGYYA